ncbi:MAG: TIGR04076 family protein [Candidatus Hodarchaeota archaeon]
MPEQECIRDKPWDILCRVAKQEGICAANYKVGDEAIITATGIKGKICITALYSLLPKAVAMRYNARFPWLENQCVVTHACPDAKNPVVFELVRIEQMEEE